MGLYLITEFFDKQYVLNGNIEWEGQDPSDIGALNVCDNVLNGNEDFKGKRFCFNQYKITGNTHDKSEKFFDAINDKEWIAAHKDVKSESEICKALEIKNGRITRSGCPW